ncbi:MAG: Ribbon-helix-helix protein, copG family [Halomonas sp. HL-93]|nr:MAG: Ribbon-helix-helix protein, copG family [Halomonas sp. HL-93]
MRAVTELPEHKMCAASHGWHPPLARGTISVILTQTDSCYESGIEQAKQMTDVPNAQKPNKKNVTAQVSDNTHRRLSALAARTDMSVAQHLRRAIDEYLDRADDDGQAELGL